MHSHEHENVTSAHARIAVFGCDRLLVRDPTASLCTYRVQMKCKKKIKVRVEDNTKLQGCLKKVRNIINYDLREKERAISGSEQGRSNWQSQHKLNKLARTRSNQLLRLVACLYFIRIRDRCTNSRWNLGLFLSE